MIRRKTKRNKSNIGMVLGIIVLIGIILGGIIIFGGKEYGVTKDGIEVEDNIIEWCFDINDCGQIQIGNSPWKKGWLDENCGPSFVRVDGKGIIYICGDYEVSIFD